MVYRVGIFTLICILSRLNSCSADVTRLLHACDIVVDPCRFRNATVTVEGLIVETEHGSVLQEWHEDRSACDKVVRLRWPAAVLLEWSDSLDDATKESLDEMRLKIQEAHSLGQYDAFSGTVTGTVRARLWTNIRYHEKDKWYEGNGYGQSGQFVAKLEVHKVGELRLIKEHEWRHLYPKSEKNPVR